MAAKPTPASEALPVNVEVAFFSAAFILTCFLAVRSLIVSKATSRTARHGLPLPPGPKPWPIIGNALQMPMNEAWETFTKWGKEHGEIVHVSVFNQSIIILNTAKAANNLFEKKSSIYSDRPRLPLLGEVTGFDWVFALIHYGDLWRKHRRVFISKFGPGTVSMFDPAQDYASTRLLGLLLEKPEEFEDHIRLHIAQQVMMAVYGIAPKTRRDTFVLIAERALESISELARPGAFLADVFPILKKLPSWVPGSVYQKMAMELKENVQGMRDAPFLETKKKIATGTLPMPCFVSENLEKLEREKHSEKFDPDMEAILRDVSTTAYGAGSDTCVAALHGFICAITLHPEVQRKAQQELDSVVGPSRLPTHEDRNDLPYITAVMKELWRWHVVAPQSLPHVLKEDDEYNGYYLPKGAVVLGNSWGILHDPEVYPDPMAFRPERYFNAEGHLDYSANDPAKFAFGYGRRTCPAYYYAENALHLVIARLLATFNFAPATDERGLPIPVEHKSTSGIVSHPSSFKCSITPRSQEAIALIRQANERVTQTFNV